MTTPPPTNPLPPELASDRDRAEAAQDHGINDDDCRKHGEPLYSGWCKACAADAIRQAREDALLAADVPGLLAEIERLRTEQADNLRAAQSIAAELVAQREEARAALAAQSRTLAEKTQQVESLREELSKLADAGIEKVLALEAENAALRKAFAAADSEARRVLGSD